MVKTEILGILLMLFSVALPVSAQSITEGQIEKSLSPVQGLITGVVNVGWTLTKALVGKDDASIAYFTYQLGFRKSEVTMDNLSGSYQTETEEKLVTNQVCGIGTFRLSDGTDSAYLQCVNSTRGLINVTGNSGKITRSKIADSNEDNEVDLIDTFRYLTDNDLGTLNIDDAVQGQVMIFSFVIPLVILFFLINDFLLSTGMLRGISVKIISVGIALIVARTGAYTGLLSIISSVFGSGGFFLSTFGIYLIIAVVFWFYAGIRKSKAVVDKADAIGDAVVRGFTADLERGMKIEEKAKELKTAEKKKD